MSEQYCWGLVDEFKKLSSQLNEEERNYIKSSKIATIKLFVSR